MWLLDGVEFDSVDLLQGEYIGFVYCITNIVSGRKYIGKKVFFIKVKRPPLKGMKRARRSIAESNWREYYGSSKELSADVEALGEHNFRREILHFCRDAAEMNYLETYEIVSRHAILRNDYYNLWFSARINANQLHNIRIP